MDGPPYRYSVHLEGDVLRMTLLPVIERRPAFLSGCINPRPSTHHPRGSKVFDRFVQYAGKIADVYNDGRVEVVADN